MINIGVCAWILWVSAYGVD